MTTNAVIRSSLLYKLLVTPPLGAQTSINFYISPFFNYVVLYDLLILHPISDIIEDELLYLKKEKPECDRIKFGLQMFEKKSNAKSQKQLENQVTDALKNIQLNRFVGTTFVERIS